MKKTSIVCALALAFAIGLTVPIASSTYAACGGICTDSVEVGKERLSALAGAVQQQVMSENDANYNKWRSANFAINQIENKTGDSNVAALKTAVETVGGDVSGWDSKTLPELIAAAESVDGYAANEDLKAKTEAVRSVMDSAAGTLKEYLGTPDSALSASELAAQAKNSAAFAKYTTLYNAWQSAQNVNPTIEDLSAAYDSLYNAAFDVKNNLDLSSVDAVLGSTSAPDAAGGDQTAASTPNADLQAFVDRYRGDETFLKYETLVIAVDEGQMILDSLSESQDMRARALSSDSEEIAVAISHIGDAMRNLGVNTTLGQSMVDPTADDLRNAIAEAKTVPDYAKYEELVRSIWEAELALSDGNTDTSVLSAILNKVQKAAAGLAAPKTGILPAKADGTATKSNSILGGIIIVVAIAAGAALVAKRQIERLNKQEQI